MPSHNKNEIDILCDKVFVMENESRSQEECKQTKSASCKGRGFNKESESENHRMEELLFHQEKRKVDEGSRLVHYLHFYKMV